VDMELKSDDDYVSPVDPNHVPAKRLRLSTIVTRSLKSSTPSEGTVVESNARDSSPSSALNHSPGLSEPEPEISSNNSDVSSPSAHANMTEDNAVNAAPVPYRSPAIRTDLNKSHVSSDTNNAARARVNRNNTSTKPTGVRSTVKPTKTPAAPPQPPLPVPDPGPKLEIPKFLVEREIYSYLSSVEEPAFRDLLKNYITFELADNSGIRGTLSTSHRPEAIAWWRSRARPSRTPPFHDFSSLTADIIRWWITLQPRWRKIKLGETFCGEGDWEDLYQPGINGLLNVVILAHWWAKILKDRGFAVNNTYSWFVSDVTWVLSKLTSAAREGVFDD
jgi:hypothetical protein